LPVLCPYLIPLTTLGMMTSCSSWSNPRMLDLKVFKLALPLPHSHTLQIFAHMSQQLSDTWSKADDCVLNFHLNFPQIFPPEISVSMNFRSHF
jgi:hypothetical protein